MKAVWLIPGLLALALAAALLDADAGLRSWWRLRGEVRAARERIAAEQREVSRLRREARDLEAGGFALERVIREELGLARPGETLVRLPSLDSQEPDFLDEIAGGGDSATR